MDEVLFRRHMREAHGKNPTKVMRASVDVTRTRVKKGKGSKYNR